MTRRGLPAHGAAILLGGLGLFLCRAPTAAAQWQRGRDLEDGARITVALSGGRTVGLDGEVRETERPLYAFTDDHSGSPPESYSWEELGFEDRFDIFGAFLERQGRWVSLRIEAFHGHAELRGTADRDYYIGVRHIPFAGDAYLHMHIPQGSSYRGEIDTFSAALAARATPVSYRGSGGGRFTPWLHVGVFGFAGDYVMEAGEARAVISYERPAREYVVGGRGTGTAGVWVPELGAGAELEIPITRALRLSLQGFAAGMRLSARSRALGVGARNEKMARVDYLTVGGRIALERRLGERLDLLLGVEVQHRDGRAEARAKDRAPEDVIARREKFDKEARFEMTAVSGFVGLRF